MSLIPNDSDRAFAALSDADKESVRRGEPIGGRGGGPIVRRVSPTADRLFDEVRYADRPFAVTSVRSVADRGARDRAVQELVGRGVLRVVRVPVFVPGDDWRDRDTLEIVEGFEHALLVHT